MEDVSETEKKQKLKADSLKKKKNKQEEDIDKVISEVRNFSDKDRDSEEAEFWMPPAGERWDFDDGGDRWGSGSESGSETEDANVACASRTTIEDGKDDAKELSKRTK
ncbi:uncharacterized protein LOC130775458 isoform X1 [Actinidia eriantha]|uniref:uncharacterized protein LOC130775458 isoform X1 n=1 Tax=Actinidia eriantha TaxID=165200 RepID=UPI00258EC87E|nr:uncharacterized protein LOC130775458 isoform X1 [Actinidia eriantha]